MRNERVPLEQEGAVHQNYMPTIVVRLVCFHLRLAARIDREEPELVIESNSISKSNSRCI